MPEAKELLAHFDAGPLGLGLKDSVAAGSVIVSSVGPGSAAEAQGVRVGSLVKAVNDTSVVGKKREDVLVCAR